MTSASPMVRRFGLIHATALNMTNMIGIGPFITIPLLMSALGGPQAMLGWLVALITVLCDSTVWSELGAAMPGSGGSLGFLLGLGTASRVGAYDYLGYYDVCYIGDEVQSPGRVIPRSILISTIAVALIYIAINFSIIGVVPWREFVPVESHPQADFVVSLFMERIYGSGVATILTAMILWTAFGSVFALLLGYSRVPYAAARDGYFFKVFARLHPSEGFPYASLVVLGVLSIVAGFVSLGMVIDALLTTRIMVQFIGQIGAVTLLRRRAPDLPRPYRMWLYPVPSLIALLGWIFKI